MHAKIWSLANGLFYANKIKSKMAVEDQKHVFISKEQPVLLVDVAEGYQEKINDSFINRAEAKAMFETFDYLVRSQGYQPGRFAMISPYRA